MHLETSSCSGRWKLSHLQSLMISLVPFSGKRGDVADAEERVDHVDGHYRRLYDGVV